ncbi:MAG: TRAP transporter small permease subunit [Deltaproteobacteria bacterium]|nr:TRAP transporter small permease subunit [Deltaproteobacteria bacterium]
MTTEAVELEVLGDGRAGRPNLLVRLIEALGEGVGRIASYLILVLALVVGYDVVMRAVFDRPTIWAQETSAMLFGTFIILGGAATARSGGHVNMDIIYSRFSARGRAILDAITFVLLTLPFLGVLVWKGGVSAWGSILSLEHDSTQWGPPLYPFRTMLPLGALLFLLQATVKVCRDVRTILNPDGRRS